PINHNAKRFLFAEDPDVKFGSLDETPLGGFIESVDMSIRHLSAVAQVPPHVLLGQIANLSAEALQAAEISLSRRVQEFRTAFGEAWERVFRLAADLEALPAADDFSGEVLWRDMEQRSLAQAADALGKLREQLGIPARGLWKRVPNVTQTELDEWDELAEDEDSVGQLASALTRATAEPVTTEPLAVAA
ncbi:phage portal protein, partial [Streptomyces goshikiensis]